MSLFLCFVRAPFKLALLNWMPLDKYQIKKKGHIIGVGIHARIGNECFTSLQGVNKGKGFLNNDRERSSIGAPLVANFKGRHSRRHDSASPTKVRRIR